MAHKLREDKTCLNCGNQVKERFCSHCGQENVEPRHSFHYLFTHFVEDLVHYDGSFWKTVKTLLFKPGKLTQEYLSGKRAAYVAPVKLYIFVSFIAFFLPAILPDFDDNPPSEAESQLNLPTEIDRTGVSYGKDFLNMKTVAELDSIQNAQSENNKLNWAEYKIIKRIIEVKKQSTNKEFREKVTEMLVRNSSKVLFVYLPIFAFWLWLFHGKKRWYYFDHGIFTLHYFSFLLIANTIMTLTGFLVELFGNNVITEWINFLFLLVCSGYVFFYFFRAHSKVYGEKKWISRLKGFSLFIINIFCILIVITIYSLVVLFCIH